MGEFEAIYGTVGLGLIVLGLPLLLELFQKITKWEGDKMLVVSVIATYLLCWLLLGATFINSTPNPTVPQILLLIIGLIIYPLPVWYGTQGVHAKVIKQE